MDRANAQVTEERRALQAVAAGRYKIERPLARGGMSTVYLAWELALQRYVAIKVLRPDLGRVLEDRERFRREARIAGGLQHPNIVPVFGFEQRRGLCLMVMGYVEGESLAERLHREGRLEARTACRLLAVLAGALDHVHRAGVIHRDVKPGNVLLEDATGRPLLTDFGIATLTTSDHSRSEVQKRFGTPEYMAPEQALGEQGSDGRSDLYALGVVGYHLLAGRLPFAGKSPQALTAQHVAWEAPPLTYVAPEVPEAVAAVVMRCLEKDPAKRWRDGATLREALALAWQRAKRPRRRWTLGAVLARLVGATRVSAELPLVPPLATPTIPTR